MPVGEGTRSSVASAESGTESRVEWGWGWDLQKGGMVFLRLQQTVLLRYFTSNHYPSPNPDLDPKRRGVRDRLIIRARCTWLGEGIYGA